MIDIEGNDNSANKGKYEFISVANLQSVHEICEIRGKINKIYRHFMDSDDEVLYITDNGRMLGVISIGDMYRYYRNEEETLPINLKFSYVEEMADYVKAERFFQRIKTIHEIPVIKNEILLGVIRKKNGEVTVSKSSLKGTLEGERRNLWRKETFRKFNQKVNTRVFYYDLSSKLKTFTQDQQKILENRKSVEDTLEIFQGMSAAEQRGFVGKSYCEKYMEQFSADYKQLRLVQKNGVYRYGDCSNGTFHIANGYRQIPNAPENAKRKIWLFGLCTVFGHYVRDEETIACYLQQFLNQKGYSNYEVVNAGTTANEYGSWWTESMSPDDIAIIVNHFMPMYNRWGEEKAEAVENVFGNRYKGDLGKLCLQLEHPMECIIDSIPHCNYLMNEKIAQKMFNDISPYLTEGNEDVAQRVALQEYFIPWDVIAYYEEYMEKHELHKTPGKKTGAIVMNCNPFTLGHRYLIEEACKQVDILYVFVVEEDRSYFKFEDRMEMVRQGTKDLEQVKVFPSGKYIISKETFSQYFEKDQIMMQIDDMDYDVRIFGEVVADMLGITCRFVGEEPFDKVTQKYNETMKRILPEYGVEVIEMSRALSEGEIISASKVRQCLKDKDMDSIKRLVPLSTEKILFL